MPVQAGMGRPDPDPALRNRRLGQFPDDERGQRPA
jgi:hypothetical protein